MTANGSAAPRLVEVSGAEALWLLGGARGGRLVFTVNGVPGVRPARHVWEHGTLVVRAPVPKAVLADPGRTQDLVLYQADDIDPATGGGWQVTATGPAEAVSHPDEAAHYRSALPGWAHGPHDLILRLRPQLVHGHRLGHLLTPVPGEPS
ncbi:pyridoxamine 5'-phosphate oxidase family protein [Yinghuangia sp. YIM S09857]|uniref:pyridoxamine 5'-phosphate oxidase family protein n=1 Tax=Yinghuangia sp. YIM S09857 TaxID=3436929 RepID=UPI003F5323B0